MRSLLAALPLALLLACGQDSSPGSGSVAASDAGPSDGGSDAGTPAGLAGISLSQTDIHLPAHANTAFAVTANFADGTRQDVTQQVDVTSSNTAVASVQKGPGSQIQVFANAPGTALITVRYGSFTQTCNVTVM